MPTLRERLAGSHADGGAGDPLLWVEVSPPRGINSDLLLRRLAALRGHADAINLTDNALTKVKLSGLVFAHLIKQRLEMPVALNMSCRDRNLLALKSDLLGAAALSIDAVVALTGDKLAGAPGTAHGVHDLDVFGLLRVIGELNRGDTGEGREPLRMLPMLTAGSVANPNRVNQDRELDLLARKAQAGARFVITQPVFDVERARAFLARVKPLDLPVLLGILPVKRAEMATYLKERVKDLSQAVSHFDRYTGLDEAGSRRLSIEHSLGLMKALAGEAAGFNIMSGGGPSLAIELALEFDHWRRTR